MKKGKVRSILESMLWDPRNNPENYRIVFISRGRPNDLEEVMGNEIEIMSDRIVLKDGRVIPHHRIVAIWKNKELIYLKKDMF